MHLTSHVVYEQIFETSSSQLKSLQLRRLQFEDMELRFLYHGSDGSADFSSPKRAEIFISNGHDVIDIC